MEESSQNFCTRCGRKLEPGTAFCPECGLRVPGKSEEQVREEKEQIRGFLQTRLKWAAAMMLIYSIPFLIIGVYISVSLDSLVNELFTNPAYSDVIDFYGLTESEMTDLFGYLGILYIISSLFGIVSSVLCLKRRMYWVAMVLCIMSFLTGAAGLFALFMGLGAFWMILGSKLGFQEYADQFDEECSKL